VGLAAPRVSLHALFSSLAVCVCSDLVVRPGCNEAAILDVLVALKAKVDANVALLGELPGNLHQARRALT